jgi:5-methylcytosine-specific restriction enzyme subunit McrC
VTRIRAVDAAIGAVLIAAFERLRRVLGEYGDIVNWLPDRGRTLMHELQHALGEQARWSATTTHRTIRYSPITESYRPAVELSLSILNQRPVTTSATGRQKVFGILLDMAEVWELYIAKVLQRGLVGFRVVHTGRTRENFRWLFRSEIDDGMLLGSLRPDIVITDERARFLALADAKYKTTAISGRTLTGVVREDLYQMSAYLSGFADPSSGLDAFLVYPTEKDGEVARRLAPGSPWLLASTPTRKLWFFSLDSEVPANGERLVSDAEVNLAEGIRGAIRRTHLATHPAMP